MEIPKDINPKWMSVIRRLQSVAKSEGLSVLRISILVNSEGDPVSWTAPEKTLIEPKKSTNTEEFRGLFLLTRDK